MYHLIKLNQKKSNVCASVFLVFKVLFLMFYRVSLFSVIFFSDNLPVLCVD